MRSKVLHLIYTYQYVYQYVSNNTNCFTAVRDVQGGVEKCQYPQYPPDVISYKLNKALTSAWEDYGPNSKYHFRRNIPSKSSNFQPTTSEWDADVRPFPLRTPDP